MLKFILISSALVAAISGAPKTDESQGPRVEKSLLNTFPFNSNEEHDHHHEHHDHAEHEHDEGNKISSTSLEPILGRQYGGGGPPGEEKCVQKVMMVEETVWENHEDCYHSYDKRCHKSYTTTYTSVQEEECDEVFRKICYIEMVDVAQNVSTNVCRRPLVKDCNVQGEEICRTEYQSECWSKQIPHDVEDDVVNCETVEDEKCEDVTEGYTTTKRCQKWPRQQCSLEKVVTTKYTTMTGCNKEPTELCAPQGCGFVEGPEICHDVVKTVISERPEEECQIEPQRNCKHVTKLVPRLQEVEECVDIPKEVCTKSRRNPKKVKKPVIKNWCYTPSNTTTTEVPPPQYG